MQAQLSNGITIRSFNENDIEAVYALIKEFAEFQKSGHMLTITVEQMKKDIGLFQCIVAENTNNEIVGFVSYFNSYYSWSGKALYIDDLYVMQSYRKQGIGAGLLNAIVQLAKETNCKKVRWQVSNWNSNGIEFYKNFGAAIDEVEINCDYVL